MCVCAQVVEPHTLVESGGRLRLNALYYITKQILPSLERVLSLVRHYCAATYEHTLTIRPGTHYTHM